ncbi:hypothetical protein ACFR9U_14100 [Halorientalis brevis]|uniref:Uncharacterized protein n=1 Tax=Halorientalis brevis TaxID=1126241 RepID=A0ABD6CDW4_9EURY|nr:hypothetical protein [Halorientalis brevis]
MIEAIEFDVQQLVVRLREDHSVSKLNLIGPDGSLYTQTFVATGETTARLQLMEVIPDLATSEHYTPGTHELVLVSGDETESIEIELQPDLEIVDVQQPEREQYSGDPGRLAVTVANRGSAPTWVHDVEYSNAPYYGANHDLADNPGLITFEETREPTELIIPPGETRSYIGTSTPLLFSEKDHSSCGSGSYQLTIHVGTGSGGAIQRQVQVSSGGSDISTGFRGQFTCSDNEVTLLPTTGDS